MPIMLASLVITPILCMVRNSWIVIWVALEINTLSFCSVITEQNERVTSGQKDSSIKYFVVQSVASAILIMFISIQREFRATRVLFIAGTSAVLVKLAASPFHGWFLEIIKSMKWERRIILITWQKLAPIYLLLFMIKSIIVILMFLTVVVRRLSQINTKTIMEVIALSSIFNLRWMIISTLVRVKTLFTFILLYWTSLALTVRIIINASIKEKSKDLSSKVNQWTVVTVMATLSGLPPTIGFAAKWSVARQAVICKMKTITTMILTLRAVNLYVYLRMTTSMLITNLSIKHKNTETKNPLLTYFSILLNIPTLIIVYIYRLRLKKDYFDRVDINNLKQNRDVNSPEPPKDSVHYTIIQTTERKEVYNFLLVRPKVKSTTPKAAIFIKLTYDII